MCGIALDEKVAQRERPPKRSPGGSSRTAIGWSGGMLGSETVLRLVVRLHYQL